MIFVLRSLKIILGILLIIFLLLGSIAFFSKPKGNDYFDMHVLDFSMKGLLLLGYSIYVLSTGWLERYRAEVDRRILLVGMIAGALFAYSSFKENLLTCILFIVITLSDVVILYNRRLS